jgi:hypothetical protein
MAAMHFPRAGRVIIDHPVSQHHGHGECAHRWKRTRWIGSSTAVRYGFGVKNLPMFEA